LRRWAQIENPDYKNPDSAEPVGHPLGELTRISCELPPDAVRLSGNCFLNMLADVLLNGLKQLGHQWLRQPHSLILQAHIQFN